MPIDQQVILETGLPFVAYLVSYIIQQAHWPKRVNSTIASATILLSAGGTLFVEHKFTGNIYGDFLAIAAIAAGLQSGALLPLSQWLLNIGADKNKMPTRQIPSV